MRKLSFEIRSEPTPLHKQLPSAKAGDAIDEMMRFLGFEHRVTVCRWLIDQLIMSDSMNCFSLKVMEEAKDYISEDLIYPVSIRNALSASGKEL